MAKQTVLECTFLVPIRRDAHLSDGQLHSTEAWEWLDDELYVRFGGRTIAPGVYEGFYQDPETTMQVSDESVKFIVAVKRIDVAVLRSLLRQAKTVFQQKSIYLSVAGRIEFL